MKTFSSGKISYSARITVELRYLMFAVIIITSISAGCKPGRGTPGEGAEPQGGTGKKVPAEQGISIHEAALNGDLSQVSALLDKGCNPDTADADGRTALMYAAFNGHTPVLKKLIQRGASVNLCDINGRTALIMASSGPCYDAVKFLLDNQADPNMTDKDEHFSALMYAASEGQTEVVKLLLAYNADPFMKDIDGDDAMTFARNNNHTDAASVIQVAKDKQGKKK